MTRMIIVVDEDIDITNPTEVMWAVATRWDPKGQTDVIDGCWTGLIDPDAARAAVGYRTAAIVAVHLYGQACDMAALQALAQPRDLLLLEDAAQAHGARYQRP